MDISIIWAITALITAVIALILSFNKMYWWSGVLSILVFGYTTGVTIALWNTPYGQGVIQVALAGAYFLWYGIKDLQEYRKSRTVTYSKASDVPPGTLYVKNNDGTYSTIAESSLRSYMSRGQTVYENDDLSRTRITRHFCSDICLNKQTTNAICNMFRGPHHTIGYNPHTFLGQIAEVAYRNLHCRGQKYPEWHDVRNELPTPKDCTQRGEVLVEDVNGLFHICDPTNSITYDDESMDWFNGDVYVKPAYWSRIVPADPSWNVVRFPNIPLEPKTRDRNKPVDFMELI